jgi:fumarylacetoacetate (FAA) hydrolase
MRLVSFRDPGGAVRIGELEADRIHVLVAHSMIDWLSDKGRRRTKIEYGLDRVTLLAPVPEPPSVRDFYAFERHVAAAWRRREADVPEYWYEAPAFYFSNPASIRGPGEPIERPAATAALDFELEIAAIVDSAGEIAGFTLMNDWSARDVQASEVTVGLGPHKAKDFATSLGPWLVTPDELPYEDGRLRLEATVRIGGRELSRCDAAEQHFAWPDLLAHAARDTRLRPGDVLGSGTLAGGCLLELGPQDFADGRGRRWLEPGDVVSLHAEGLGTLETPIARPG